MKNHLIVYTMNDCIECKLVKQILSHEGIPFEIRNISENPDYQKEVEKYGFLGVPVTVFQDRAVKGFTNELKDIIELAKVKSINEN